MSVFNHRDAVVLQSYRIRWSDAKWGLFRHSRSFKVTDVSTNRTPVCDFLLVIDTEIPSRTVWKLLQIIV